METLMEAGFTGCDEKRSKYEAFGQDWQNIHFSFAMETDGNIAGFEGGCFHP